MGSKDIEFRNISLWVHCNFFRHSYLTEVMLEISKVYNTSVQRCRDKKIIIYGEFLVLFVFFYVTYKVSKKALVFKPQWKCFQSSCLGLKIYLVNLVNLVKCQNL